MGRRGVAERGVVQGRVVPLEVLAGGQEDFVRDGSKHPALLGGVGSGKTVANVIKGFIYAGNNPGALGCLTSPTFVQLRDNMLPAIMDKFGEDEGKFWDFRRGDMEIRFRNGAKILLRPAAEAGRLRGLTLAFFGMDEIAIMDQEMSFLILQGRLRQKGFVHQGWVTTTPHWRRQWIRKMWQDKRNPSTGGKLPGADYVIHHAPTSANFFNPVGFVEGLRQSAPGERYIRQELYGEFIDVEGVAFPQFSERTHVRMPPEGRVVRRAIGVDFGGKAPTAVEEFCLLENGEIQGTYEFYERDCAEKDLVAALADRPRCKVLCDPSGTLQIDQLRRYGINAHPARIRDRPSRKRLWTGRLNLINRGTGKVYEPGAPGAEYAKPGIYLSPKQANLVHELLNLAHASIRGTEQLKDEWEQGLDDHGYDAGAYCLADLDPAMFKVPQITVTKKLGYSAA